MSDTLRERIAEACCLAENAPSWSWVPDNGAGDQDVSPRRPRRERRGLRGDVYYAMADAVLSVLHEAGEQGDGQRQRNELLNTFAPTEPTVDDVPRSEVADAAQTQSLLVGWLTDAGLREPMGNDGLADRVVESMAGQGWRLQRTVLASPAVAGEQGDGLAHSLAVALIAATTEAQEGIKPNAEALRHRDSLVQRVRLAAEVQRQRREMFDTFAPTEPTVDDLQRSPAVAREQGDELCPDPKCDTDYICGDGGCRMNTLLADMGHERWVDAWREAADWRDQYRRERGEAIALLHDLWGAVSDAPDELDDRVQAFLIAHHSPVVAGRAVLDAGESEKGATDD